MCPNRRLALPRRLPRRCLCPPDPRRQVSLSQQAGMGLRILREAAAILNRLQLDMLPRNL